MYIGYWTLNKYYYYYYTYSDTTSIVLLPYLNIGNFLTFPPENTNCLVFIYVDT